MRVLTNAQLRTPGAWHHLLPGLGQAALFAGVAILGLGIRQGALAPAFGPPSTVTRLLGHVVGPLSLSCYMLFFLYGLRALEDYRRYRATRLPGDGWAPLVNQRSLLILLMLGFGLGLGFVTLDAWFGPVAYSPTWYAFAGRAGLIFGLAVVGLQASCALAAGPGHRYQPLANGAMAKLPAPATEPTPDLLRWRDRLLLK